MSLTTLPILPLEAIISYLDFSSIVSLANSHPSFAHLQPKEQIVIGEDFCISGKGGCMPIKKNALQLYETLGSLDLRKIKNLKLSSYEVKQHLSRLNYLFFTPWTKSSHIVPVLALL